MSNSDHLLSVIAATAAAGVTLLVALQSDRVSQKILKPDRLDAKRRSEYNYNWKTALDKAHLQLDYYLAGSPHKFEQDNGINFKNTEYMSTDHDLEALIRKILKKESRFLCLKIAKDVHDPSGEYYLFLLEDKPLEAPSPQLYQVPLVSFGLKLAQVFEDQLTTTTFCFVADASSGTATSLLEKIVNEAKTGVAVLSEPMWMIELANIVQANVIASAKVQKLLFALCRLEAWSLRDETKDSRTVMITLPGQSTTSTLLPLVQQVFPEDRHVFAYDGCINSVHRGILANQRYKRGQLQERLHAIISALCQNPARHTTPLPSNSPLTKKLKGLVEALSALPKAPAQVVETWMGSVDAFFKLKEEDKYNGYLPYVFKLDFLTKPVNKEFKKNSDSYWSLCSLLQFITGNRSRPMPDGNIDAAVEFLKDFNRLQSDPPISFSNQECKQISECVFQHKLILIENKTLQDTCLPRQHWTLKQASKKGGCACCGPDPLDEEEEEEAERERMATMNAGPFAMATDTKKKTTAPQPGFVDGKLGFAFDPTRFS